MSLHRDFKGIWIPKMIWLNKDMSIMEKLFLVEIDSLDNENGCFASNAHFSEMFDVSKGRCTQIIKSLESKGFVKIQLIRDKKVISKRLVRVVNKLNTLVNKLNTPSENIKQGYLENDEGNNTSINNTNTNNTKEDISAFAFLNKNCPSRLETEFKMRYHNSFKNKKKFIEDFDDTVIIEINNYRLRWDSESLLRRLSKYAKNYIEKESKNKEPEEQKPVYLRNVM
jgi:hypothetical protein